MNTAKRNRPPLFLRTWPPFSAMGRLRVGWGRSYTAWASLGTKSWPVIGQEVAGFCYKRGKGLAKNLGSGSFESAAILDELRVNIKGFLLPMA